MAKTKISVSLNPATLAQAQALVASGSVSDLLDVALHRLIDDELVRQHVAGYEKLPVGAEFSGLANTVRVRESDDDVDWAALYGINE